MNSIRHYIGTITGYNKLTEKQIKTTFKVLTYVAVFVWGIPVGQLLYKYLSGDCGILN